VDILFNGSMIFKCTRRSCGHMNTLNYFPGSSGEDSFKSPCIKGVD
jgi:hypothetical protein